MEDHLTLPVDHLLIESTLRAASANRNQGQIATTSTPMKETGRELSQSRNFKEMAFVPQLVECRICQEEEEDYNMEIPCSCCGSLKFAHRECVQRWCDAKGDTICEICLQQFKPGYTASPKLFQYGSIPMNFRGNWEVTRQDLRDSRFLALIPSERHNMLPRDEDLIALGTRATVCCCQSAAVIFMVLFFLRQMLLLMITGAEQYSFTLFADRWNAFACYCNDQNNKDISSGSPPPYGYSINTWSSRRGENMSSSCFPDNWCRLSRTPENGTNMYVLIAEQMGTRIIQCFNEGKGFEQKETGEKNGAELSSIRSCA